MLHLELHNTESQINQILEFFTKIVGVTLSFSAYLIFIRIFWKKEFKGIEKKEKEQSLSLIAHN